jgi:hypothetical protein
LGLGNARHSATAGITALGGGESVRQEKEETGSAAEGRHREGIDAPPAKTGVDGRSGDVGRNPVVFYLAALHADILFELARGGGECVAQGDVEVFVGLLVVMVPAYHDMLVRDAHIDSDFVEITLMLMMMFCFDCNSATDDVIAELFQFYRFFPNSGFDRIGMRNAPKRNL